MKRRDFLKGLGWALAAGWGISRLSWPLSVEAGGPDLSLALLADAHLRDGDPARPEARALARAVAEIRALRPAPDLVLFAGDLAHDAHPGALALGREILSDLRVPILAVRGEGDALAGNSASWSRLFGETAFVHRLKGINLIGLDTTLSPGSPGFVLGDTQLRWLARELDRLNPDIPLVLVSHAPLTPIFPAWQQWTWDAHRLAPLLARFRRILCLHGHVHHTENRKPKTENPTHLPLPATAWPLPWPLEGTPHDLRPGLPPWGCGWGLLRLSSLSWEFTPRLWQV